MMSVIDIFAGPGGLGEGFSVLRTSEGSRAFRVCLSIEKDFHAWQTLRLRSFFREFPDREAPAEYYQHLRGEIASDELFETFPEAAQNANSIALQAELGREEWPSKRVNRRIRNALRGEKEFVLIGGPPCQAYSTVGRSRNKGNASYKPEDDHRTTLYIEYLQILADHRPPIFIMENVKGLLSATLAKQQLFKKLLRDLVCPYDAIRREARAHYPAAKRTKYRLFSLTEAGSYDPENGDKNFVIRAERHGIPQARHRVIILGVREDLACPQPRQLVEQNAVSVRMALKGLPRLRSGLSRAGGNEDSPTSWVDALHGIEDTPWYRNGLVTVAGDETVALMRELLKNVMCPLCDRGGEFIPCRNSISWKREWFQDGNLRGFCNHASREHMLEDIYRYFYAACYADRHKISPQLRHFPQELLPKHKNVSKAMGHDNFADRFRVQVASRPSTTITSHIRKDGHYYIHPDPTQCRSLTVREAARLQTFPDNYFFCGPRTSQYEQVGNAVPPLLALQIAEIVYETLRTAGKTP